MRLQDPEFSRVVIVALAETTPVSEAAELQNDLRRAGIEPARGRFDRVLVVDCSEATQIARVCARPGVDETVARGILAAQASRSDRLAVADDVVFNEAPLVDISSRVDALHRRYVELASTSERAGV